MNGDISAAFESALEGASTPAAEASPASTPTPETPAVETTAAATVQPATEPETPAPVTAEETPKGEPPAWRWQDILKNAREESAREAAARAKQELEQQYAGLQDFQTLSADEREGLKVWHQAMRGDPSALARVQQAARTNPQLASALRQFVQVEQSQPDVEPQPDAAIQLADGSTVPVFTPEGMKAREAWMQKQLTAQLEERFKPLATTAEKLRQIEQRQELQQQTSQWAAQAIAPLTKLPYFSEFKPELAKALHALPPTASGEEMTAAVYDAYTALHTAKLTHLTTQGASQAVATLQQRAIAGTPNPSTASAATPKTFRPDAEGFKEAFSHFGATG
jgi:hypothetical protein